MAETLSRFLQSPEGKGKTILVLAGGGHVVFDFGIPKRVYRRVSVPYQTIVLREWKKTLDDDLTFAGATSPPADFLWFTPPAPPEKKKPRIGVTLKMQEAPQGLAIERVIPESPAEKAGLLPGDQFIAVEGKEIKGVKDIHAALDEKGWGKEITFTILRDGIRKEIIVKLPPAE
jgi:membrane-associated protease RseP (regulator of RpoE activity)